MKKPCEYCGCDLPLGVDKDTRRIRSRHFSSCKARPSFEVESPAPVPTSWMEMVTANLVREGVNKHKARELAEHFYGLAPTAQPAVQPVAHIVGEIDHTGKVWKPVQPAPVQPVSGVVLRDGLPALLQDKHIKETDQRLCIIPPAQPAPVQEPVGWFKYDKVSGCWHPQHDEFAPTHAVREGWKQLYTTPPAAQPAVQEPVADAWMHKDGRLTDAKAKTARVENFHGWRPLAFITSATPPAALAQPVSGVVLRDGCPTLIQDKHIKETDQRLCILPTTPPAQSAVQEPVALEEYDAGLLNDYGGGNVEWWQDYIRAELGRAYEHYQSQIATPPAAPVQPVVFYRCNGCGHAYEQVHPTSCDCMEAGGFDRVEYFTTLPAAPVLEGRDWSLLEATQESLREHMSEIKRLKAAQPAPVQEPVAFFDWLPEGTTHIAKCKATTSSGGNLSLRTHAFKYEADVLKVYTTDNDNEYPGWRAAKDVFYHLNFAIVPLYTTPPAAQPAVPDAMTSADIQEHIEYVAGWNECRQAMLEMTKNRSN